MPTINIKVQVDSEPMPPMLELNHSKLEVHSEVSVLLLPTLDHKDSTLAQTAFRVVPVCPELKHTISPADATSILPTDKDSRTQTALEVDQTPTH